MQKGRRNSESSSMRCRPWSRGRRVVIDVCRRGVNLKKRICKTISISNLATALESFSVDYFEVKIQSVVREGRATEESQLMS